MRARRLAAPWIVPVLAPPIRDGAMLVDDLGRVAAIGRDTVDEVPAPPDVPAEYFPDTVLLPGLVNAHTHLELTGLGPLLDEPDFPSWIRRLRALKAERTDEQFEIAAEQGIRDCWAAGVTTVGDTGDTGSVARAIFRLRGRGVAFQEVFGPYPDQCDESLSGLQAAIAGLRQYASPNGVRLGVSPHAPYTVSAPLYRAVGRWARQEELGIALHLAESQDESLLLADATGGFAGAWARRGIPAPQPLGMSPASWVDHHMRLDFDTLCIHAVHVDADDIALMAARKVTVAHCPLSNRAHAHGDAPLAAMLAAGIEVGVGTDSVLSVGTLDLIAEARAARWIGGISAARALELITHEAAVAIGYDDVAGWLRVGGMADVAAISLSGEMDDPVEDILTGRGAVLATFVGGREVYRRGNG